MHNRFIHEGQGNAASHQQLIRMLGIPSQMVSKNL